MTSSPDETDMALGEVLRASYALTPLSQRRVAMGQATVNYHVRTAQGAYFVKCYFPGADLIAEQQAITQTERAGRHGVPVAALCRSERGEAIVSRGEIALSVWHWVDGEIATGGLTTARARAAGYALGRIHAVFADQHESHRCPAKPPAWLDSDVTGLQAIIDDLLSRIPVGEQRDDFDHLAAQTLLERRAALKHVPDLMVGLPPLSAQVLHGDYSAVNLLFSGDTLAAVLDFRPPEPFLIAYELGRIAFDPRTVCHRPDWHDRALALVSAYRTTHPTVAAADVTACARLTLIRLLTSLYGVKNHYRNPGLLQADLDQFWLLRHRTADRLLEHLLRLEADLNALTRSPSEGAGHD